jgi:hypothetical protein
MSGEKLIFKKKVYPVIVVGPIYYQEERAGIFRPTTKTMVRDQCGKKGLKNIEYC